MLWHAGTEPLRSYLTGCTTVRQVPIFFSLKTKSYVSSQYSRRTTCSIFFIKLPASLPHSGYVVCCLHIGRDDYKQGAFPRTWQYPFCSLCYENEFWALGDKKCSFICLNLMLHGKVINNNKICCHESQPASSGIDQLKKILNLTGTPDYSLVQKMQSKDVWII